MTCHGCGGPLSILVKSGLCGRCKQWGVVPEWAELVARRVKVRTTSERLK